MINWAITSLDRIFGRHPDGEGTREGIVAEISPIFSRSFLGAHAQGGIASLMGSAAGMRHVGKMWRLGWF